MVIVFPRVSVHSYVHACGRTVVLGLGLCLLASPSGAQTTSGTQTPSTETPTPFNIAPPSRPARPYRGVFGVPPSNLEPRLTLEASLGGGLSGNPVADQAVGAPGGNGSGGGGGGAGSASSNLLYSWTRERMGVNATNATFADYYPNLSDHKLLPRDIASAGIYFVPKPSTRITFSETFKNLPEFSLSDLHEADLGELIPPNLDFGMTVDRYTRYGTSVDVSQKLSNRTRADLSASYARGMIDSRAWTIVLMSGSLTHTISKGLAVYGGYQGGGQRDEHPLVGDKTRESHPRINGGIDFNRALSFARRTTLSFSTGTAGTHDRSDNTTTYHLVGAAKLDREIGRTWNAGLQVARTVRYIEVLSEPLFSDSLGVVLNGSFSRRFELKSVLSASTGHLGTTGGHGFDTYVGSVELSIAMTRNFAFGSDYVYSRLASGYGAVPTDALRQLAQQSVRAYVKIWAPLLTRRKQE
jgi:hypothetical protein